MFDKKIYGIWRKEYPEDYIYFYQKESAVVENVGKC